jgi:hypothetical protein
LSLIDKGGKELWSTSFDATVPTNYRGKTAADSVYAASSVFLRTSPPVPSTAGANVLRLSISPRASAAYDILDAWIMPR